MGEHALYHATLRRIPSVLMRSQASEVPLDEGGAVIQQGGLPHRPRIVAEGRRIRLGEAPDSNRTVENRGAALLYPELQFRPARERR
jgi:hypothetical protein